MLPQASQMASMQGMFKPEKPNLSYADLHQEITKVGKEVSPKSSWKHKKLHADDTKANEEEELVKYMSNLPSYLERGANPQEKVLNVGVLEWGRLEKWQCNHKQILHRSSISSLSSSNTSSLFSTDESSAHSSRGHSCSPARQRLQRPSLQSHMMSVPIEGHLPFVKPFRESVGKFQDLKAARSNAVTAQGKFMREDKSFCKNNSQIKLEQCKRREMHPKIDSGSAAVSNGVKDNVTSCDKVRMKNQVGEFMKKADKFQEVIPKGANQDVTEKRNTVVLLLPRDLPKTNHSGAANLSDLRTKSSKKEAEASQRTFPETSEEVHHAELSSNFHHSGPLPCELDGSKHLRIKAMGSVDANGNDFTSERSCSVPRVANIEINSSRSRNLEERRLNATPVMSAANEACKESDPKVSKVASEKARSSSPFRRFSFSMGKTGKSSGSKEGSSIPQVTSTLSSAKTDSENPVACGVDTSCGDKLNAKGRARSSPLRRLLDPLLKPKAVNCRNFTNQLQDSILTEGACKSSERLRHSTVTVQSAKMKSDSIDHCTINVNESAQNKKYGSSAVQALFRVQVKNGLPLFTFAVDNESNILAATVKMLSASGKGDYGCIYTFFDIQEVRKKNGRWINQVGKGKGQDYVPNVVAQMKVSGSEFSHLSRPNHVAQFSIREFVLLTLDVRQANSQASDFQPNDEQAAIVVKIPKRNRSSFRDGYLIDKRNNLPEAALKEHLPEVKLEFDAWKKGPFMGGQDIGATVILPSGVHSLPNKGEPSSLIQRWKSGGACDCGGWDLGCKLRILSNKSQFSEQSSSLKGSSIPNQFELFFQGGVEDNMHFFSLAPFKDGIYSVEFNSSLSLMQAFSICIAVLDSRKHSELSESIASFEERTLGETELNDRTSALNPIEGEAPARYAQYPPVSPVGRV
ncbi:uncharacterized protein LOC111286031 [Durio zibethinus]|uniref:Uncharacterized protein LOC111286031 n=1 Tax=Durio zibethinus TaxID=66656 RepID=A0A6P5XTH8_DURZI|nr:uncharacterized protein LOC111286031 [Durio zibethinus]